MIFCDSSFLIALLVEKDYFHAAAASQAAGFTESIPYTLLAELEVTNTLRRALREKAITRAAHDAAFLQIERDLADGILTRRDVPQSELYRKARELSKKHTPVVPARSLDILHTATALILGADTLCSLDLRQRDLAKAAGLKLLPAKLPK
jgi:predicted nucleic acid-binding protein